MTDRMVGGVPQADGTMKPEPRMPLKSVSDALADDGQPAARQQRAVHERDGDQDAVRWTGVNGSNGCIQRGDGANRPPLDRPAVHLHDHARPGAAVFERPLHDARPEGQRQAAAARVFDRQRELRRPPRVPQHQGAARAAHLAAAAHPTGRNGDRRPQAHRHAGDRLPAARAAPLHAGHRHGLGALHEHRARPRNLREVRAGGAGARRAPGRRAGLPRRAGGALAEPRVPRRAGHEQAALLPHRHAPELPQHGAHHRADRDRARCSPTLACRRSTRRKTA